MGTGWLSRYSDSPWAGSNSGWGARFSAPVQTDPVAHPAPYAMGTGSFLEVKRPGLGVDHPSSSSAEVEGRVELYIYSPSGPSWSVLGRTLLYFTINRLVSVIGKQCLFYEVENEVQASEL